MTPWRGSYGHKRTSVPRKLLNPCHLIAVIPKVLTSVLMLPIYMYICTDVCRKPSFSSLYLTGISLSGFTVLMSVVTTTGISWKSALGGAFVAFLSMAPMIQAPTTYSALCGVNRPGFQSLPNDSWG